MYSRLGPLVVVCSSGLDSMAKGKVALCSCHGKKTEDKERKEEEEL